MEHITLFGKEITPSSKHYWQVPVGEQANGATVTIPVMAVRSATPGPTLWINGTVHGAELNGSVAAYRLFSHLKPDAITGTVIVTPIANPLAFQKRHKVTDLDDLDMDTAFPGRPNGTWTEIIAHMIYSEIRAQHPDCVVNCHTMGPYWQAVPYTVSKRVPGADEKTIERSFELALAFGVEDNCHFDLQTATGELPGVTSGALDITCIKDGIPCFMIEMGGGGRLQEENIRIAQMGLGRLLDKLGITSNLPEAPKRRRVITRRTFLRTPFGGLLEMQAFPGREAVSGTVQGVVHYFGRQERPCLLEQDVFFIGTRYNPVVNTGDPIAFVGTEWHFIEC